jgi:hypothetical protein
MKCMGVGELHCHASAIQAVQYRTGASPIGHRCVYKEYRTGASPIDRCTADKQLHKMFVVSARTVS